MVTEQQIAALRQYVVPLTPKNKRGFTSKHDPVIILQCIRIVVMLHINDLT